MFTMITGYLYKLFLTLYIFKAMVVWVPLTDHAYYEKLLTTQARYESIAETIVEAAQENPLFEDDEFGLKTALVLASIASYEGVFRADVDSCKVAGDNGIAWSLWQVHDSKYVMCSSRLSGARVARERVRESFTICKMKGYHHLDRLSIYTDGSCRKNWKRSQERLRRAMTWSEQHPFDQEITSLL